MCTYRLHFASILRILFCIHTSQTCKVEWRRVDSKFQRLPILPVLSNTFRKFPICVDDFNEGESQYATL